MRSTQPPPPSRESPVKLVSYRFDVYYFYGPMCDEGPKNLSRVDAEKLVQDYMEKSKHGGKAAAFPRDDGPFNIFGGSAARDEVLVDENGVYQPLPPPGAN